MGELSATEEERPGIAGLRRQVIYLATDLREDLPRERLRQREPNGNEPGGRGGGSSLATLAGAPGGASIAGAGGGGGGGGAGFVLLNGGVSGSSLAAGHRRYVGRQTWLATT